MIRAVLAVSLSLCCLVASPAVSQDLQASLQALLDGFQEEHGFPGATVALALPDGRVISAASGLSDLEARTPMTPETRMLAASIGKSFVAMTVLSLENDGVLSRSDPVTRYLGERDWFERVPNHETMTIGNLLRHAAGVPDHVHLDAFQAAIAERMSSGAAAFEPEEAVAFVLDADPLFEPGSGWAYTDTGYLLLGLVIEEASGQDYYDLVAERLLSQLNLTATARSDTTLLEGLAVGYVAEDNPFGLPVRTMDDAGSLVWDPGQEWTGGGLVSTSRDLAAWGHTLFTGAALDVPYLERLLDAIPVSPDAPSIQYGAGVAIYTETPRGPVYGHGGWIPGYVSSLRHYADHGVTVAFQINTDVGIADDSTDLVPSLEAVLADLAIGATATQLRTETLITNVRVVDVATGNVTPGQSVLIRDGLIADVGEEVSAPDATVLEANARYLIPGLWDSHVHIFSSPTEPDTALPLYLLNGITGIRDMGALWPIADQQDLQARIEAGEVLGPRLILSGAWVDAAPGSWPGMFLADSPDEAREVVDQIAGKGWAAVKSYSMLDEATYAALAEAADNAGLPLVGHIPERVALGTAIDAGQAGMEHFGRIPMACSTDEPRMLDDLRNVMAEGGDQAAVFGVMAARNAIILDTWDETQCNDVLARMAGAGLHVSPTLVVADFYLGNWPAADTPRMRMIPAAVRDAWGQPDFRLQAMTDEVRALAEDSIALDRRTFAMAHAAGVPILASSDASFANPYLFHGFSLLDELDIYVAAGLTPLEALYTATVAPPRFFSLADQDGTIAPGRRADLVLLDENPLEGLETLRTPQAVVAGGVVLDRAALDAMAERLFEAAN
ncbi:MAG: serine hydrolase [Pseudomonadota bacterium]